MGVKPYFKNITYGIEYATCNNRVMQLFAGFMTVIFNTQPYFC